MRAVFLPRMAPMLKAGTTKPSHEAPTFGSPTGLVCPTSEARPALSHLKGILDYEETEVLEILGILGVELGDSLGL